MDEVEEVERKWRVGASCGHYTGWVTNTQTYTHKHTHTNTLNVSLLHTWFHSVRSLCILGKQIIMDDYEC